MKKKNNLSPAEQEFEKYLQKIEDPKNNQEVNYDLPENANSLEATKFNICQSILAYQQDNNLTDEEVAERINLTVPDKSKVKVKSKVKLCAYTLIICTK